MSGNSKGNVFASETVEKMKSKSVTNDVNIPHIDRFKALLMLFFYSFNYQADLDSLLKDIDVNSKDEQGNTALHLTVKNAFTLCTYGHTYGHTNERTHFRSQLELITLKLLSKGADINICNNKGETPLFYAVKFHQDDAVYILLKNEADPDLKDKRGDTPLLNLVRTCIHSYIFESVTRIARLLLETGANVHAKDRFGRTALELVINKNDAIDQYLFTELLIWGGSLFVTAANGMRLLNKLMYPGVDHELRTSMCEALWEYVLALKCANLDYSEYEIVECTLPLGNVTYTSSLAKQQIDKIKKVSCGSYSLYNIFGNYRDPKFVFNKNLEDAVNMAVSYKIRFLDYRSLLKAKFLSAKKRYKIMVKATEKLTNKLPNEIVWNILTYLSDEDLKSVTFALRQ